MKKFATFFVFLLFAQQVFADAQLTEDYLVLSFEALGQGLSGKTLNVTNKEKELKKKYAGTSTPFDAMVFYG